MLKIKNELERAKMSVNKLKTKVEIECVKN